MWGRDAAGITAGQVPIKRQRTHTMAMTASHAKIDKAAIARKAVCGDARSTSLGCGTSVPPPYFPTSPSILRAVAGHSRGPHKKRRLAGSDRGAISQKGE